MTNDILLVDDDPGAIRLMGQILADVGRLRFATNGAAALRQARAEAPDLILLDAEMPGMDGFDMCRTLKADPLLADVPVIFVTSHSAPEFELAGFELGAADFIAKPVSPPLVIARVRTQLRLKNLTDELRRVSAMDALTGVANRRRFDESLEREWTRTRRSATPLTLLMVDVDHFKLFNDTYGHPAGDDCLHRVAQAMTGTTKRPTDLVARYGGEEFALLLPATSRDGASRLAARVIDAVAALNIAHSASPSASHVTVSIGIACYDDASPCWISPSSERRPPADRIAPDASMLVRAADQALYAAKAGGRARSTLSELAASAPARHRA
jgi:diguanylate cyclase (GGDEF)-like protein